MKIHRCARCACFMLRPWRIDRTDLEASIPAFLSTTAGRWFTRVRRGMSGSAHEPSAGLSVLAKSTARLSSGRGSHARESEIDCGRGVEPGEGRQRRRRRTPRAVGHLGDRSARAAADHERREEKSVAVQWQGLVGCERSSWVTLHGMGGADSGSRLVPQACERFPQTRECTVSSALGCCR